MPPEPDSTPGEELPRGTERLLLVDDEPSVATAHARLLGRLGYRVTARTDSVTAVALFRQDPAAFDLVFTDMTMPALSGDSVAAAVAALRPGIPILLCSGYSEKLEHEPPPPGVVRVLRKPLRGSDLARAVRNALDGAGSATR